jgi:transposase-like protein
MSCSTISKMPVGIQVRQVKYFNNIVEQDHRFVKQRVRSMKSFCTVKFVIPRIEAMHVVKKTATCFTGSVCSKLSEIHPPIIWMVA